MPMSLNDLLNRNLFSPNQWSAIVRGDRAGLDILTYADTKLDPEQMDEIIRGLSLGLDVSIYNDPGYTSDQTCYLRWGLEKRMNILTYNDPAMSVEEMKWYYNDQRRGDGEPAWGGYLPLGRDMAEWLFQRGAKVILLYADARQNRPATFETLTDHPGLFAIPEQDEKSTALYRAYQSLRRQEVELLTSDADLLGIYQVKEGMAHRDLLFERLERLEAKGLPVSRENYQLAYVGYLEKRDTLNSIYQRFNLEHPKDYTGRSLSDSDVVLLRRDGKTEARYVDSYDFPEIQGFFGPPMQARNNGLCAAYELEGGKHLTINLTVPEFNLYTIVGPDFLDNHAVFVPSPARTIDEARQDAATRLGLTGPMREVNYEMFLERAGLASKEPTVEILFSESGGLHGGQVLLLHDMDQKIRELDAAKYAESQGNYYDKTNFEIHYMMDGELRTYEGRQDLGDGEGGLLDHIQDFFEHYRTSETWQARLEVHGDREQQNEGYDYVLNRLLPYFKQHVALSALAEEAGHVIADAWHEQQENGPLAAYGTALSDHARACRRELNTAAQPQFPPPPQKRDFLIAPEMAAELEQQRRDLWHEARAHGKTPQEYLNGGGDLPTTPPAKSPRPHRPSRPKGPGR